MGNTPPLRVGTKVLYGIGQAAEGLKNASFEWFLFFYYSRALGLSGTYAGLAVALALLVDAVTDPLAGSISDSFRHKWGRRHPFMYAAAVPLGITFALLFAPPAFIVGDPTNNADNMRLFGWLAAGAILVRTSMTLYHVPHLALGAELSDDYHERTGIVGFRVAFSALGAFSSATLASFVFLRETDTSAGKLDPSNYPALGWWFGAAMILLVLLSGVGTHSRIPYLRQPSQHPEPIGVGRAFREFGEAFRNRSFRFLIVGVFIFFVARGVQLTLQLDMLAFFWKLEKQWKIVPPAMMFAFVVGIVFWTIASRRLDKKPTLLVGFIGFSTLILLAPLLELGGLYFARASPLYAQGVIWTSVAAAFLGAAGVVSANSMLADIADEHELASKRRQEGIFFGALSFSVKSSSGAGHLIAGVAMDAISFPTGVQDPSAVPSDVIRDLGWVFCGFLVVLGTISVFLVTRYGLTRERHTEIARELAARRGAAPET